MPTYLDTQTGRKLQSQEPLTDAELEEAFGGPKPDPGSAISRAADYIGGKIVDVGSAAGRLTNPYEMGRPWKEQASDVLTAGAPFVAPIEMAAGTAAGAGARALGVEQPTADVINAGVALGTGLGRAGIQGLMAPSRAKTAVKATYEGLKRTAGEEGYAIRAGSKVGDQLVSDLNNVLESGASKPGERAVANMLLGRLRSFQMPSTGEIVGTGPGASYEDLSNALTNLKPGTWMYGVVKKSMMQMLHEVAPEAAATRAAADVRYASLLPGKTWARQPIAPALLQKVIPGPLRPFLNYTPNQLAVVAKGAAPGLARTAAAVSGPALRSLGDQGIGDDVNEPAPGGTEGDIASIQPESNRGQEKAPAVSGPYGREIAAVAKVVNIPAPLIHSFVDLESSYNPNAKGTSGEIGLMQIMPETWKQVEGRASQLLGRPANIAYPLDNLVGGALILKDGLDKTGGDWRATARYYNGGPGGVLNPKPHTVWYQGQIERRFRDQMGG